MSLRGSESAAGQPCYDIGRGITMAIEALEIRMARLEGGYEQINERLGGIEQRLGSFEQRFTAEITSLRSEMASRTDLASLRSEMASRTELTSLRSEMASRADLASLRSEMASMRSEMATRSDVTALRSEMRAADADLRKQMKAQFFWLLTFVLGSILVPILRHLA